MADRLKEDAIVLALKAMALLKADDAPKVELLLDQDRCQTYKVCADGRRCWCDRQTKEAALPPISTQRPQPVTCRTSWLKILGHDAERGILVEEWLDPGEYKSLAQDVLERERRVFDTLR